MNERLTTKYDLLTEPLISVRSQTREVKLSLPGVLEILGRDQDVTFPALRRYQSHAWHAFLVQLAVMALYRGSEGNPSQPAHRWRDLLLQLSDGNGNAWCLVVEDLSEPAFMQPPVPEGTTANWRSIPSPGALDVLVTAKNHDVKAQLVPNAAAEHWALALISLQTMQGFLGAGKWGVARMNGGFGSRPCVTFARSPGPADRFQRDTGILLRRRDELVSEAWPYESSGGKVLLWTEAWDGESSYALSDCDPYFIEVCRRVRLQQRSAGLSAVGVGTKRPRVEAKEFNGVTGDPWTPVLCDGEGVKALTVSSSGFNYSLVRDLLFSGEYTHGMTWRQVNETGDMYFLASVVTRGQGKTEGYHERRFLVPALVCSMMGSPDGRDRLARDSGRQVSIAEVVRKEVLRMALLTAVQGAPEGKLKQEDQRPCKWLSSFDKEVDSIFFERLFCQLDMDDDEAADAWALNLIDIARQQLNDAINSVAQASIRSYRIQSTAYGVFFGCAKKHFPDLFEKRTGGAEDVTDAL